MAISSLDEKLGEVLDWPQGPRTPPEVGGMEGARTSRRTCNTARQAPRKARTDALVDGLEGKRRRSREGPRDQGEAAEMMKTMAAGEALDASSSSAARPASSHWRSSRHVGHHRDRRREAAGTWASASSATTSRTVRRASLRLAARRSARAHRLTAFDLRCSASGRAYLVTGSSAAAAQSGPRQNWPAGPCPGAGLQG